MDETRQIETIFFLFFFINPCLLCSTAFPPYFNNQIQNQIVSSKTFFVFPVSTNPLGLFFFYSVIAHLSVLVVPVWKAFVAMEMAEWPFAVG